MTWDETNETEPIDAFQEIFVQVNRIANALEQQKDPAYEASMRRAIPSSQPAHATRLPVVRAIAREWAAERKNDPLEDIYNVCEVLWSTGWREERLVAIFVILAHRNAFDSVDYKMLERWSREIDNWELVDQLAAITGKLLERQPRLLTSVRGLANSDSPWQRRLALVTMIVASKDEAWIPGLANMTERLANDSDPSMKKAIALARQTLKKRQAKVG